MRTSARNKHRPKEPSLDDADELPAILSNDQLAWRRFVARHEPRLREAAREVLSSTLGKSRPEDVDDVVGAFWLRMIDDDKRWLRAFRPERDGTLSQWLAMHPSHVAHEHGRERRREGRRTVALDDAKQIPMTAVSKEAPHRHVTIDHAIREAVRDVVRQELQIALRELSLSVAPSHEEPTDYLSIAEAAMLAKVHPATVRAWIREGRLQGCRAGRYHRIKRADLHAFLSSLPTSSQFDLDAKARELAG